MVLPCRKAGTLDPSSMRRRKRGVLAPIATCMTAASWHWLYAGQPNNTRKQRRARCLSGVPLLLVAAANGFSGVTIHPIIKPFRHSIIGNLANHQCSTWHSGIMYAQPSRHSPLSRRGSGHGGFPHRRCACLSIVLIAQEPVGGAALLCPAVCAHTHKHASACTGLLACASVVGGVTLVLRLECWQLRLVLDLCRSTSTIGIR